jgi:FMN-dependent NADH-azoreductase
LILGSPRGRASCSHQIARRIVDDLKSHYPSAKVVVRNLTKEPLPEVSDAFVTLMAADVLVLATPMHNFGVSASLKAWIDQIVRPGLTFSYSDKGPLGLVRDKKAVLVLARGGIYAEGPMKPYDFQEPYLRTVLGFIGMTDVEVIRIEGVAMGDDAVRNAVTSAKAQADDVVRLIASGASVPALAEAA